MFKLPADIAKLSIDELKELLAQAVAARDELLAIDEAELTDDQINEIDAAVQGVTAISEQIATVETAAQARADRIAAARAQKEAEASADADGDEGDEDESEGEDDGDADADADADEIPDDASELEGQEAAVVAAGAKRGAVGRVAASSGARKRRTPPEPQGQVGKVAIVAAANVPSHTQGQALTGMRDVAEAFKSRTKGFAHKVRREEHTLEDKPVVVTQLSKNAQQFGVARIQKEGYEFDLREVSGTQDQMELIMKAANEKNLPKGGLVAAGGWCAPSETLYGNFLNLETVSGLLSIPEVVANRGGINFTKGPDYATIAAAWGFMQTEAQAEAGTTKTCFDVACPPFEEVRLDAIGFCVKAGVLTEAAYPELIDRVLQIGQVAHAHKVNASVISRISTKIGAAISHTEIGATTNDLLDALVIQALRLRYTYSMDPNATIEAVLPLWAKEIIRADLGRRTGVDMLAVTDAQIQSMLGVRGIAAQWVYDYQNFTSTNSSTWTSFPDALEVMLYPAGAFVKLTDAVIDLDTIYDSVGLSTNTFTAAFFEEGLAVANTGATGVKVSIDIASLHGRTGAANVGSAITP